VNLAARLCEHAEPDQILLALDGTLVLPVGVFATEPTAFRIKGFVHEIAAVALVSAASIAVMR
jgi:class 3 adenylate cyclase